MSLTRDLTRLIATKPVAGDDLAAAAAFVLDTLANALAARAIRRKAKSCAIGTPAARPIPDRRAFLFGALAHILEMDDLHRESVTHPGCVVIPAAWAVAVQQGSSGQRFLARRARRLRSGLPHRQRRRPRALRGLAQHVDLRALWRRNGCRHVARAARGADRLGVGQRRHASGGLVAVPRGRRHEQAFTRRARRRGGRARRGARGARLHRPGADSGRPQRILRRRLPRRYAGACARSTRRAMAAQAHVDQALAVVPPHARDRRRGARAARSRRGRLHRRGPNRNLSSRARALRPAGADVGIRGEVLAAALRRCSAHRRRVDVALVRRRGARSARGARGAHDGRRCAALCCRLSRTLGRASHATHDGRRDVCRRSRRVQRRPREPGHAEGAARQGGDAAAARRVRERARRELDRCRARAAGRRSCCPDFAGPHELTAQPDDAELDAAGRRCGGAWRSTDANAHSYNDVAGSLLFRRSYRAARRADENGPARCRRRVIAREPSDAGLSEPRLERAIGP